MIEIGVDKGGSLLMWKEFFGEKAKIVGLDINPECKLFEDKEKNIFVEIGSQSDEVFLDSIIKKFGTPHIILDDGGHVCSDQKKTFEHLFHELHEGGIYFVEDLHTSYWEESGGGFRNSESFIEFVKNKIDEINAEHTRGRQEKTRFTNYINGMSIYDSVVIFEKRKQGKKLSIQTGDY